MAEETWPSFRYGPDDQAQVFASADDVPEGWADHPSKVKGPKPDEPEARRRPRPELMEALRQRGVQFAPNAGGGELAALLAASEPQAVEVDSNGKVLGFNEPSDEASTQPGPNPLDPAALPHVVPPEPEFPAPPERPVPPPFSQQPGKPFSPPPNPQSSNEKILTPINELRAAYRRKFNKNPGPSWDEAKLREKLA